MKLSHPDSSRSVEANPGDAEAYLSQGWVEKSTSKSSATKKSAAKKSAAKTVESSDDAPAA